MAQTKMTNINIRIDSEVKQKAQELFGEIGMDMSTAINIFLRKALLVQGIPFDLSLNAPNAETVAAIKEAMAITSNENTKRYGNFKELLAEVLDDGTS